jgi:hypothetical protein
MRLSQKPVIPHLTRDSLKKGHWFSGVAGQARNDKYAPKDF